MNIMAIANQKGGCGKTTTTINLAAELGQQGKQVLVIDMDPQGHASLGLGVSDRDLSGLYEVFSDEANFYDVVISNVCEGVDLVPANISLAMLESLLADQPGRERQLLEQLERFGGLYDYILIDCPPSLGLLSINALRAAEQVLVPIEASCYALDGIRQLLDIVNLLRDKYQIDLPVRVLPTMFDTHTRFAQTVLSQIREQLPVGISGARIRHTVRVREAAWFGKTLPNYAPGCTAAADYRQLAEEIMNAAPQPRLVRIESEPVAEIAPIEAETLTEETTMTEQVEQARRQMVVLTFDDIDCHRLQIAGDFNGWIPDRDIETRHINGNWQKVFTAEPGVYEYRLVIDGKWQADPTNPSEIPNELGGINSLLQVPVHH
ncbi:Chromosome (plasmid) partitioning protein ParA [hydrothermal vent metagenome]|uniref:Chromosome (Plasmid) partitioning protein ParA n=1 Tax=hydrothermal vent metagenome TaxID=652676 RepID=A0A3B0YIM2_9ZZZZ